MRIYVIDADVLITAANRYYAFEFNSRFWDRLAEYASLGQICSIDRVQHQIDWPEELVAWVAKSFRDHFASTDEEEIVRSYGEIMKWALENAQYSSHAKAEFGFIRFEHTWLI